VWGIYILTGEIRGIVGEERRGKETDRCPLTISPREANTDAEFDTDVIDDFFFPFFFLPGVLTGSTEDSITEPCKLSTLFGLQIGLLILLS
jgi:hypothetical protein